MPFELVAYEKLKISVKDSIKTLIEYHLKKDAKHAEERAVDIHKLSTYVVLLGNYNDERTTSSELLLKVIELIEPMDEKEKTIVLNAAAFRERSKIPKTVFGSTFEVSLTTSLGLDAEKQPSDDDLYVMYNAYLAFLETRVFNLDEKNHLICVDKHPFSCIKGYDVFQDVRSLNNELHDIKMRRVDTAAKEHQEAARPAPARHGYFGFLGGGSSSSKKPVDEHASASSLAPK